MRYFSFLYQSVNMVSSVNRYKISLEPAKRINEKVRKLLCQTVGAREGNVKNRTRRSKIKRLGIIVRETIGSEIGLCDRVF